MENGHTLNTRTGAGNMKNERKPILLVIAGPNGSGKSTITGWFDIVGEYTNADEMVAATGMSNLDAAVLADQRRYAAIERHADLTFETVLSSEYKLEIVRKAKAEGYFIKGVFVLTTDPKINKSRVKSRVADGGHDVDESKITPVIINLWEMSLNCCRCVTYCIYMIIRVPCRFELFGSIRKA